MHHSFCVLPEQAGQLIECEHGRQTFSAWFFRQKSLSLCENATHYGYVCSGSVELATTHGRFPLKQGMYFSLPSAGMLSGAGAVFGISQANAKAFFHLGGPIESTGRLRYIDGCSDSLLISPVICGQPCLNLLHLPAGTSQTAHTHPSFRLGVIVEGSGECRTPTESVRLHAGMMFMIPAETVHSFFTFEEDLLVIAFHPDSDFGPRHEDHPMINRTIVNGISAAKLTIS